MYLCTGYVTNAVYRVPAHGASHREVDVAVRQVSGQGGIESCTVADGGLYGSARSAVPGSDGTGTAHDGTCRPGCGTERGVLHSLFGDDVAGYLVSVAGMAYDMARPMDWPLCVDSSFGIVVYWFVDRRSSVDGERGAGVVATDWVNLVICGHATILFHTSHV